MFRAEQSARRLARSGDPVVASNPAEHLTTCDISTLDLLDRGVSMGGGWAFLTCL